MDPPPPTPSPWIQATPPLPPGTCPPLSPPPPLRCPALPWAALPYPAVPLCQATEVLNPKDFDKPIQQVIVDMTEWGCDYT